MKQAKKAPKIFTVPAGQFDCGYVDPVTGDVLLRCSGIDQDKLKDPAIRAAMEEIEYTPITPAGKFDCIVTDLNTGESKPIAIGSPEWDEYMQYILGEEDKSSALSVRDDDYGPGAITYETYDSNGNIVDPLADVDPIYKEAIGVERRNNNFIASAIASLQEERDAKKARIDKECRSAISGAIINCLSNTKLLHQSKDNTYDRDALVHVADGLETIYSAADKAKAKIDHRYNIAINEAVFEHMTQANIHRDAVTMCVLVDPDQKK
jgi:hypothetical protein